MPSKRSMMPTAPSRVSSPTGSKADFPWISASRRFCPDPRPICAPSGTWMKWSTRPMNSRFSSTTNGATTLFCHGGCFWKRNGKNCGPPPWKPSRPARSWKGLSKTSPNTVFSSTWAVWTDCCILPIFPGAGSNIRQSCIRWVTRSRSRSCPMTLKKNGCL